MRSRAPRIMNRSPALTDSVAPCHHEVLSHASLKFQRHSLLSGETSHADLMEIMKSRYGVLKEHIPSLDAYAKFRPPESVDSKLISTTPLAGVLFDSKDVSATSPLTQSARQGGALCVGETKSSERCCFPARTDCGNPYNPQLTCGGSTSGSAISVSCGLSSFAVASNGGGSIRIPAAFCALSGLVLEPNMPLLTGTTVRRDGILARRTKDLSIVLDAIVQTRTRKWSFQDLVEMPRSLRVLVTRGLEKPPKSLIPGYPPASFWKTDGSLDEAFDIFCDELKQVAEVSGGSLKIAVDNHQLLPNIVEPFLVKWMSDARGRGHSSDSNTLHEILYHPLCRFEEESGNIVALAKKSLAESQTKLASLFGPEACDVIITPSVLTAPWQISRVAPLLDLQLRNSVVKCIDARFNPYLPLVNVLQDPPCRAFAGAGMCIPIGLDKNHLPVGGHLMAMSNPNDPGKATSDLLWLAHLIENSIVGRPTPPFFPRLWSGVADVPVEASVTGMFANGLDPAW
jgi:Asp-tRNA(Asn)/Glu-tRNA(Gln) amidotransferase A subunit family amidase